LYAGIPSPISGSDEETRNEIRRKKEEKGLKEKFGHGRKR